MRDPPRTTAQRPQHACARGTHSGAEPCDSSASAPGRPPAQVLAAQAHPQPQAGSYRVEVQHRSHQRQQERHGEDGEVQHASFRLPERSSALCSAVAPAAGEGGGLRRSANRSCGRTATPVLGVTRGLLATAPQAKSKPPGPGPTLAWLQASCDTSLLAQSRLKYI